MKKGGMDMKKRILGFLLAALMCVGVTPVYANEAEPVEPIANMYLLSRGAMVEKLYELEGAPAVETAVPFKDVDEWYADAVAWAAEKGIVAGYDADTFGPDDYVRREQLASILYRYAKYKGMDVSVGENTNILSYTDAFDISGYAFPAMQWACGSGILTDVEGEIFPHGYVAGPTADEFFEIFKQ